MIAFTAAEIAEITNGRLDADPGITPLSVVTDSRESTHGSLYVAKPGEHADGHDFVAAAFAAGAALALLAGILSTQGHTVARQGSYNGEIGVPLPVFRAGTDTRYLVIGMGATR